MDIVETLKQDYQRFPENQTYSIYADDVYFKDPLNEFRGRDRYKKMIGFIGTFFGNVQMDVHHITRKDEIVKVEWTLNLTSPLPWKPRLAIPGWTDLKINSSEKIVSHIDRWHISPFDVLLQNFGVKKVHNDK
ncbi:DUF2358 domain-containing protein [Myxosarcina sp. GI1]|uniref:DUF2358 domain-containing protein n=1 Tax=Myxosarcina sp. GI1 TaxID=1541065 RepID=UPI00056B18DE|nr:DUF2358 domain-containing protein [Myxosarcina sp. GI1]